MKDSLKINCGKRLLNQALLKRTLRKNHVAFLESFENDVTKLWAEPKKISPDFLQPKKFELIFSLGSYLVKP